MQAKGFSLLELIAALAVISTLTAIGTVGLNGRNSWPDQICQHDEAKALLNSAAGLPSKEQGQQRDKDVIDEESPNKRIDSIGYIIDKEIKPINAPTFNSYPRMKMTTFAFRRILMVDGSLSKFAIPHPLTRKASLASAGRALTADRTKA